MKSRDEWRGNAPDLTACRNDRCIYTLHRCVTSVQAQAYHEAWQLAPDSEHDGGCWCCCWECPFDPDAVYAMDDELGVDSV